MSVGIGERRWTCAEGLLQMGVKVNSLFGGAHVYYRSDVFLFSYRGDGVMHCGGEYNASTVVLFSLCQRTAHRILHLVELRTQSAVTFGRREGWILSALRNDLIPSMLKIQKSQECHTRHLPFISPISPVCCRVPLGAPSLGVTT